MLVSKSMGRAVLGRLVAAIFNSAETVHLVVLLCYLGDAIRSAVSADLKMVSHNRPLGLLYLVTLSSVKHMAWRFTCVQIKLSSVLLCNL